MRTAWRATPVRLASVLAQSRRAPLTYAEVGASSGPDVPAGYRLLDQAAVVGCGRSAWSRVADALLGWGMHREAGMVLATTDPDVRIGTTVVNAAPFGPVALLAPCRVVSVVAGDASRRGFAYGTLPGHPLAGEERFSVELDDQAVLWLRIRSFSRPVGVTALSPPMARAGQRLINRRYFAAVRRLAA